MCVCVFMSVYMSLCVYNNNGEKEAMRRGLVDGILMIFCCAHRPVASPGIAREASFSTRWEQLQRPTTRHYEEKYSKLEVSIEFLPW